MGEINAVMKRKDNSCARTLSDQGKAATVSNFGEYTVSLMYAQKIAE